MKTYLVTYDLIRPVKDYEKLFEGIRALSPVNRRCLLSTWIIRTELSAVEILNSLKPYIDKDDKILVFRLRHEAAWEKLDEETSYWIVENLPVPEPNQ